jgi:hypothetical protein
MAMEQMEYRASHTERPAEGQSTGETSQMTVETLRGALLWCGIINYAMLMLWAALFLLVPRLIHWPCRWLRLTTEQLDVINYGGMLLFKLAIFLFNLVPYVALRIVA